MTHDDNLFTPETVDEQVEEFSQAKVSLIGDLKGYYQVERREDSASLERAWKRVSASMTGAGKHSRLTTLFIHNPKASQERVPFMRNQIPVSRRGNFSRRLSLLVAVLVAIILVGGLAVVLNLSHHTSTTGGAGLKATSSPTATHIPKPTSTVSPGKTLYTTPSNRWGFESLAWSPDSKRVASATVDPNGVQFWDATTGDHLVTVTLPGGQSEWAYGLEWSPDSVDVVVATNQELLVVNGQTGAIIKSHSANAQTALSNTIAGHTYLTRLIPASGGFGFRAAAWSPDGKLIAAALSYGVNGIVQVWNPQSDAIVFTLKLDNTDYNVGSVAWSSDGQYIAATTWNTQGTDPTQPGSKVVVWNVSTQQLVFQHSDFMDSSAFVAWQP